MADPKLWTREQLAEDAAAAKAVFRKERLDESLDRYKKVFSELVPIFGQVIDGITALASEDLDPELIAALVQDKGRKRAFRYLAAPPISEDDLKTLAETTLSPTAMRRNPDQAKRVRGIVLHLIDPHRFPWIVGNREPAGHEREQAIVASAALLAARRVETSRRTDAKKRQEDRAKGLLRGMKLKEVLPRSIPMLDDAPAPGEYCGESKLGDTRADIIVRLHDRRTMPIECKVSNSAVNSFKRVNHEAAGKATKWLHKFGQAQIVPAAILSGVFNPTNLETAQGGGLFLFWSHRLSDLADYVGSTRPS